MKDKQISIVILMFLISITISYAAPKVFFIDNWRSLGSTDIDEAVFADGFVYPSIIDAADDSKVDMICYDWNDDGSWNNCYWDKYGCGGSCNANSCNSFDVPNDMNDNLKEGCDIAGDRTCVVGVDTFTKKICPGCSISTSSTKFGFVDARVYYDCGNPGEYYENVTGINDFKVVKPARYDCNVACDNCALYNHYDLEGQIGFNYWIVATLTCNPSTLLCSESLDDYPSTPYPNGSLNNPCGGADWGICTQNSDCVSNKCVNGVCIPCNSKQCAKVDAKVCIDHDDIYANQYYCDYDSKLYNCTSSYHNTCEEHNSNGYYCTNEGSWQWRFCNYGCDDTEESCIYDVPGISVNPTELWYEEG